MRLDTFLILVVIFIVVLFCLHKCKQLQDKVIMDSVLQKMVTPVKTFSPETSIQTQSVDTIDMPKVFNDQIKSIKYCTC